MYSLRATLNVQSGVVPSAFLWCGNNAVVAYWDEEQVYTTYSFCRLNLTFLAARSCWRFNFSTSRRERWIELKTGIEYVWCSKAELLWTCHSFRRNGLRSNHWFCTFKSQFVLLKSLSKSMRCWRRCRQSFAIHLYLLGPQNPDCSKQESYDHLTFAYNWLTIVFRETNVGGWWFPSKRQSTWDWVAFPFITKGYWRKCVGSGNFIVDWCCGQRVGSSFIEVREKLQTFRPKIQVPVESCTIRYGLCGCCPGRVHEHVQGWLK